MSSDHEHAAVGQDGVGRVEQALSAKKLRRMVRAMQLVLVRGIGKHQPKLAALGVSLHHMVSSSKRHHHHLGAAADDQSPSLTTYLSAALSCRFMDPAAAVHPYPPGAYSGSRVAGLSSLSCRSMDPDAAVYQYRPREVEFSCKSTPLHRRRRRAHRHRDQGLLLQKQQQQLNDLPKYGSVTTVKTLFELIDGEEDDDGDMETPIPWAASATVGRRAPRQVRITDSPFLAREDEQEEENRGVVDRRADEFILWFHDQLRMQQQQQQQRPAATDRATYWVR